VATPVQKVHFPGRLLRYNGFGQRSSPITVEYAAFQKTVSENDPARLGYCGLVKGSESASESVLRHSLKKRVN
jgi:hypothetical protein